MFSFPSLISNKRMVFRKHSLLLFFLFLNACSSNHPLVSTPNIYSNNNFPVDEIPISQQTITPKILYVTDRLAEKDKKGKLIYKSKRSSSMVVGEISVKYGEGTSWDALVDASSTQKRVDKINLEIAETKELVKFPATPMPFELEKGEIKLIEPGKSELELSKRKFNELLSKRLAEANSQEIILFIHGYNNSFTDAGLSLADIWHFTGRFGVPITYTWPAASGGLFGYFKDREAGEFTIFHLKEFIRLLSEHNEVENIHIVSHSRGTDITTSALRELLIESRAAGISPREKYKITNLFLAAPDMDFGVVSQRLIAEKIGPAFGQITVYMNKDDGALGLAQRLMSGLRFGRAQSDNLSDDEREIFARIKNVNFVNVEGVSGLIGHSYFRAHPGVLSDIVAAIKEKVPPGNSKRPLAQINGNFWTLPKDYLLLR